MRKNRHAENYIDENDRIAQKKKLNNKLLPFNIIIAALSIIAIVSLLSFTFWKAEATYTVDDATLEMLVANGGMPEGFTSSESLGISVDFEIAFKLEPMSLIAGALGDNQTAVSKMLDDTLENVMDTAKHLVKQVFKAGVKIAIATAMVEISSNEEVQQVLEQIHIEEVENIINELLEPEPDTVLIEEDLINLLKLQFENMGETFTPEMETEIRASYNQTITQLSDEEGNFSVYSAAEVILEEAGVENQFEEQMVASEEQLVEAMRSAIMQNMDAQMLGYVALAYKIIGWILIVIIALWGLLLLSSVLRIFAKNKGVKVWYVILLCALPYLILVLAIKLLLKYGMQFAISNLGEQASLLLNLSISVSGIVWVSAACVLGLILLSIFGYGRMKKEARRI